MLGEGERRGLLARPERLAALSASGLMDSVPEPEFDRVTRLICQLLNVEVSLVSLVDTERQFFKSSCGLPAGVAPDRQTPLSHSFCQYVVASEAALMVPNMLEDADLSSHLAVRDMNVMAYLGVPIRNSDGYVLGSLCAIETRPREWSNSDRTALEQFALIVQDAIAMRNVTLGALDAAERNGVLAQEYNHRAKNTLAVASALVGLSAKDAKTPRDLSENLQRRLMALSDAHDALLGSEAAIDMKALLTRLLNPFTHMDTIRLDGPQVMLAQTQITPFSLIIHELATNSAKYGAIRSDGHLTVEWTIVDGAVLMTLIEETKDGSAPAADQLGFGQTLLALAARQLGGTLTPTWHGSTLTIQLRFPLMSAA